MDIKTLQYFSVIAEFASFSKAAAVLKVGQPLLSRKIHTLEEEIGAKLFYRNGRGIVLTEAGKVLEPHSKEILNQMALACSAMSALNKVPAGRVSIGIPPAISATLAVPLLTHVKEHYPQISLDIVGGYTGLVLEWIATGRVDAGILFHPPRLINLLIEPLVRQDLSVIGPAADPAGLGDGPVRGEMLARIPLILPTITHGLRALVSSVLEKADITPQIVFEIDALEATVDMIDAGAGYTLLTASAVRRDLENGRLRAWPLIEPRITGDIVIATSSSRPVAPITVTLIKAIRQLARRLVADKVWCPSEPAVR